MFFKRYVYNRKVTKTESIFSIRPGIRKKDLLASQDIMKKWTQRYRN